MLKRGIALGDRAAWGIDGTRRRISLQREAIATFLGLYTLRVKGWIYPRPKLGSKLAGSSLRGSGLAAQGQGAERGKR